MGVNITREEHEEFVRRIDDEHKRINRRLELLEESNAKISDLVVSVEKLAINMETMANELKEQGSKMDELEERDGRKWRDVTTYVITAIVGIVIGFVFKQFGM